MNLRIPPNIYNIIVWKKMELPLSFVHSIDWPFEWTNNRFDISSICVTLCSRRTMRSSIGTYSLLLFFSWVFFFVSNPMKDTPKTEPSETRTHNGSALRRGKRVCVQRRKINAWRNEEIYHSMKFLRCANEITDGGTEREHTILFFGTIRSAKPIDWLVAHHVGQVK